MAPGTELANPRAHKCQALLEATSQELETVRASVAAGRLNHGVANQLTAHNPSTA